jgi:hypothetical protein
MQVDAGAFQIVAGWWGHQPGRPAVGGVPTAHNPIAHPPIRNAPIDATVLRISLSLIKYFNHEKNYLYSYNYTHI